MAQYKRRGNIKNNENIGSEDLNEIFCCKSLKRCILQKIAIMDGQNFMELSDFLNSQCLFRANISINVYLRGHAVNVLIIDTIWLYICLGMPAIMVSGLDFPIT